VTADHELLTGREDWQQLAREDEGIDRARQGYRDDPAAAKNLETVGWPAGRAEAALEGRTVIIDPDTVPQHGPLIDIDRLAGRPVLRPQLSAWAEFSGLHNQVHQRRVELMGRIHPEIEEAAAARERELLEGVPDLKVRDLDRVAGELTSLCRTLAQTRAAAGVHPREGELRQLVTSRDMFDAAAALAAGVSYTLLAPVTREQRSMIVGSQGLGQDAAPIPRKATTLPPAGVILKGD